MEVEDRYVRSIGADLKNDRYPLSKRFRALFYLKNLKNHESIKYIADCFDDKSALLKHELAYCLGQINDPLAMSTLISVLNDVSQETVVRHEAAEALGAIGDKRAIDVLNKYERCDVTEIAETCRIALDRLDYVSSGGQIDANVYGTIDPAPPSCETDLSTLEEMYLNENLEIFERYRAMFALRNLNTDSSVDIITKGFHAKSVLFRHEVAFVLGQLQNPVSVRALVQVAENERENNMVRHEAIEALGAIGTPECVQTIRKYLDHVDDLIRESCQVALDIQEYNRSCEMADPLQYKPIDEGV